MGWESEWGKLDYFILFLHLLPKNKYVWFSHICYSSKDHPNTITLFVVNLLYQQAFCSLVTKVVVTSFMLSLLDWHWDVDALSVWGASVWFMPLGNPQCPSIPLWTSGPLLFASQSAFSNQIKQVWDSLRWFNKHTSDANNLQTKEWL